MVDGEDVRHLDVQSRLRPCVQIVELIDVEVSFGIAHVDYCDLSASRQCDRKHLELTLEQNGADTIQRL